MEVEAVDKVSNIGEDAVVVTPKAWKPASVALEEMDTTCPRSGGGRGGARCPRSPGSTRQAERHPGAFASVSSSSSSKQHGFLAGDGEGSLAALITRQAADFFAIDASGRSTKEVEEGCPDLRRRLFPDDEWDRLTPPGGVADSASPSSAAFAAAAAKAGAGTSPATGSSTPPHAPRRPVAVARHTARVVVSGPGPGRPPLIAWTEPEARSARAAPEAEQVAIGSALSSLSQAEVPAPARAAVEGFPGDGCQGDADSRGAAPARQLDRECTSEEEQCHASAALRLAQQWAAELGVAVAPAVATTTPTAMAASAVAAGAVVREEAFADSPRAPPLPPTAMDGGLLLPRPRLQVHSFEELFKG